MLLRLICLVLGTALTAAYLVFIQRGKKYDPLLEGIPDEGFSDKELFAAGFGLQELAPFSMKSRIGQKLLAQARLLHPENEGKYAEFWAKVYWARTLSLTWLVAAISLCGSVLMKGQSSILVLAFGVVAAVLVYSSGADAMNKELKSRSEECLLEFSNVVSKLALLMGSGMILRDAWSAVAYSKQGAIYTLMQHACDAMRDGKGDVDAIYEFGLLSDTPEIRKFSGILIQNIHKGGADLTVFLTQQSSELWSRKRQMMLQKGDEAAAKLLIPTTIMLAGILLIIVVSSLSGMQLAL